MFEVIVLERHVGERLRVVSLVVLLAIFNGKAYVSSASWRLLGVHHGVGSIWSARIRRFCSICIRSMKCTSSEGLGQLLLVWPHITNGSLILIQGLPLKLANSSSHWLEHSNVILILHTIYLWNRHILPMRTRSLNDEVFPPQLGILAIQLCSIMIYSIMMWRLLFLILLLLF